MNTTPKSETLALAALAIFAAPATARIEGAEVRIVMETAEPAKLPILGLTDAPRKGSVQETVQIVRMAASRKTKKRLRASTATRIEKNRILRKPVVPTTRTKTLSGGSAPAHGSPVFNLPEDFAP